LKKKKKAKLSVKSLRPESTKIAAFFSQRGKCREPGGMSCNLNEVQKKREKKKKSPLVKDSFSAAMDRPFGAFFGSSWEQTQFSPY
jgi:hypothetical protein